MDPLTLGLIFSGGSLLKHFLLDKPAANRQRHLAAETERYSPWTGNTPNKFEEPNLGGSMLQGGFTGAQLGANMQTAQAQKDLMGKIGDKFQSGTPVTPAGQVAQPLAPSPMVRSPAVPDYSNPWRNTLYGN